ncbi:coenzyme Q10-like protein B-like protein, partial [Mortierella sp. GBAus27b]
LVADVDQYQQFLPWCTYSKIGSQLKTPVIVRHGELGIGFNSFQERYVSKVTCQEPWAVRAVSYDSKLFKELSTTWRFAPDIPKTSPSNLATMKPSDYPSCWVDFEIQFEFASPVHASMSSLFFDHVSKEMLRAFINRAEVLYG